MVPEYENPAIGELTVAPYRLIYRHLPDGNRVRVLAVIHGSRQLPPLTDLGE